MKRSEMLEKIKCVLGNNHPALDYQEVAGYILDMLDNDGMLPPGIIKDKVWILDALGGPQEIEVEILENVWENE